MSVAWRFGLWAASGVLLVYGVVFRIKPEWIFHPLVFWGTYAGVAAIAFLACRAESRGQETYTLQSALRTGFSVYALATVAYHLFYWVLIRYIDPGLIDLQHEVLKAQMEWWAGRGGSVPNAPSREELELTPGKLLFSLAQSLIGGFVTAAAIGFAVRRR